MTGPNLEGGHIAPSLAKKSGCSCWVGGLLQAPSIPWKRNKGCCQDSVREGSSRCWAQWPLVGTPAKRPHTPSALLISSRGCGLQSP